MRCSMGGCVAIRLPLKMPMATSGPAGSAKNKCEIAGLEPTMSVPAPPILARARIRPSGLRVSNAASASAWYSRLREIAERITVAITGAMKKM